LDAARQIAARTNRLVLVHFWAPWCKPCLQLEKDVFSRPEVARALEANFVMVKLNVDETPATARLYGVSSMPTDVIISPNGRLVSQMQSPPTAGQYIAQMNRAAAGHRDLLQAGAAQVAASAPQNMPAQNPAAAEAAATASNTALAAATVPYNTGPANGAAAAASPTAPAQGNPGDDRYAEYYRQNANGAYAATQASSVQPGAPAAPAAATAPTSAYGAAPAQATTGAQPGYPAQPQVPAGIPPLGLDGFCPVTLVDAKQWGQGDKTWGVVHRGHTYLFLGPAEKERFLANPDRYTPVLSGLDPVLALDNRVEVAGRRDFGVFGVDGRICLFADEASLQRYRQNPARYSGEAMQAAR
jgi:thioredoxin-like negative regulator of GroEL/YHS domain-containing protein